MRPKYLCSKFFFMLLHAVILAGVILPTKLFAAQKEHSDSLKTYELDKEIVVTAQRTPTAFSDVARSVTVITRHEIEKMPVESLTDLLEYIATVDVRQQGINGAQSDISIRGATFEQTLILLDGVKMTDPQTGHHNLDLPVDLQSIERIEVVRGPGSRLYGPNAFGGIINIITRKGTSRNLNFQSSYGNNSTYEGSGSLSLPVGKINNFLSFSHRESAGYRENTEYRINSMSYYSGFTRGRQTLELRSGFLEKNFGANSFYGSPSTRQWEGTRTYFLNAAHHFRGRQYELSANIFWRRHKDHYIWNREHPDWYENFHTSQLYGIEQQFHFYSAFGITGMGVEISREEIKSNLLQSHGRNKQGVYFQQQFKIIRPFVFSMGASAYHYSNWGWQAWPGMDVSYKLSEKHRIYGSVGKAFRVPTYTELYYHDPNNQGNPRLQAESAWSYEIGDHYRHRNIIGHLALFRRFSHNLIDWVQASPGDIWRAQNITGLTTNGLEVSLKLLRPKIFGKRLLESFRISYSYLDSQKESRAFNSRYSLTHLKHQLISAVSYHLMSSQLSQTWQIRYEDRLNYGNHMLVDTRLTVQWPAAKLFFDTTNLLNRDYREHVLIPMPGRKFRVGIAFNRPFRKK